LVRNCPELASTIEQPRALLAATAGRTFPDRRYAALIRIFFATGDRRAEVAETLDELIAPRVSRRR
jgi:hypothetical protein